MTSPDRQRKIDVLKQFPSQVRQIVATLSDKQLTTPFLEDEWSVAQIVHHCADSHMNSYVRLKLILTEDNPTVKPYAEPLWAQFGDATTPNMEHTLTLLDGLHARWTATWESITDDQWARAGLHPDIGAITLDDLLDIYDNHCRTHLDQIRRVLAAQPDRMARKVRRSNVALMKRTIAALVNISGSLSQAEATTWRDGGDGWTVLEVLCHLRDFDGYFRGRVELMVNEENPPLPMYDHEQIAIDGKYNEQTLSVVVDELSASRQQFIDLFNELENSAESYQRTGTHPEYGSWSILDSLIQVGLHDADHLQQIARIIAEKQVG